MSRERKKTTLRCAIIGTGRIGSRLEKDRLREKPASHAGAIRATAGCTLVAGADKDREALTAFGTQWKLPPQALFTDPAQMLKEIEPELVSIAADSESHIALLDLCLEHKVPLIILEKPVAQTAAEAQEVLTRVEAAERAGTSRVVVNHERRFARDYRKLQELLENRTFGRLLSINAKLYMGKTKTPARVLWHDGTHLVDIISFLIGAWQIEGVHGDVDSADTPFCAIGRATGGDSPLVILDVSPGHDHLCFELEFNLEKGRIRCGNGVWEVWKSEPSPYYEQFRSLRLLSPLQRSFRGKTRYFANMMAHAAALARDPAMKNESSFADGARALAILDRIISLSREATGTKGSGDLYTTGD